MRNGILNRNRTTWGNTDAWLAPRAFYEPTVNQEISIREPEGRLMISWITHGGIGELKHEKGMGGCHFGTEIVNPRASHGQKSGGGSENFRFFS